jgi:hypothetical protein
MPQGKCSFCGTFVTGGGIAMGKHSVACRECAALAEKYLAKQGQLVAAGDAPAEDKAEPPSAPAEK